MTHDINLSPCLNGFDTSSPLRTDPPTPYRRIVVPVKAAEEDYAAISLGVALASGRQTEITLLNFLPESIERATKLKSPSIGNCLDAISLLHDLRSTSSPPEAPNKSSERLEESRSRLKKFIEHRFPAALRAFARIQIECQFGQFERDIVPFCHAREADLVILTSRMASWWGLPMVDRGIRNFLHRERIPVAIVRPTC